MEEQNMVLRTEDLVKRYGKRTVVSHVSFDVKQGEIVGLLGPNGAGKTTSFYMTVGLVTANAGHIYLGDLEITGYPVYKRAQNGIAYLAQEEDAFTALSRTFTEEQKKLFLVYEDARNACAGASEDAYARQAFLLAKEIFR